MRMFASRRTICGNPRWISRRIFPSPKKLFLHLEPICLMYVTRASLPGARAIEKAKRTKAHGTFVQSRLEQIIFRFVGLSSRQRDPSPSATSALAATKRSKVLTRLYKLYNKKKKMFDILYIYLTKYIFNGIRSIFGDNFLTKEQLQSSGEWNRCLPLTILRPSFLPLLRYKSWSYQKKWVRQ